MRAFTTQGKTYKIQYQAGRSINPYQIDDLDNLVDALTYSNGERVEYQYDDLGRLQEVKGSLVGGSVLYDYVTKRSGDTAAVSYPNGVSMEKPMNSFGEIVKTEHSDGWSESNQYDGYGNVVESRRPEGTWSFRYDKIDRITEVSSPYASDAETYEYDDLGNRKTVTFGSFPMPTTDREYEYDALNRLTQVKQGDEKTSYSYYPNGLRAAKSNESQTTQYVYLNGQVVEELDGSGRIQAQNIFGNGLILRKDNQTYQSAYYLTNSHGDVTKLVDANSGDVLNSYEYDIWGNPRQDALNQEEMSNPFRYAGEVFDAESGMIYLRARYDDRVSGGLFRRIRIRGKWIIRLV